jgi:hypothetical protein
LDSPEPIDPFELVGFAIPAGPGVPEAVDELWLGSPEAGAFGTGVVARGPLPAIGDSPSDVLVEQAGRTSPKTRAVLGDERQHRNSVVGVT